MKKFTSALLLSLFLSLTAFGQPVSGGASSLRPSTVSATAYPTPCTPGTVKTAYLSGVVTTKVCVAAGTSWSAFSAGSSGTVTSVSVTTANGVSGSVATATTTPAITLTLGAITPSSVTSAGLGTFPTLAVGSTSVGSGIADINGFAIIGSKTAVSGLGGHWRYRDDTGTSRWLGGILGSGGATDFSIYDIVNSKSLFTVTPNATASAFVIGASSNTMSQPLAVTGDISATTGNLVAGTAGKTVSIKTGTNACIGSATLSSGTATVSTTCTGTTWGTDFIVHLTPRGSSVGLNRVSTHTAGTSFVITSSDVTSTDQIGWTIIKLN